MNLQTQAAKIQSKEPPAREQLISREEVLSRLEDPSFVLVNVMPKETFETRHVPHSINLPVAEIERRARELFPDRGREIVVYCAGPT